MCPVTVTRQRREAIDTVLGQLQTWKSSVDVYLARIGANSRDDVEPALEQIAATRADLAADSDGKLMGGLCCFVGSYHRSLLFTLNMALESTGHPFSRMLL